MARAAVAAIGGVAVLVAAGSVPALAAQRPGGAAASRARPAIGQHAAAGRMSPRAPWTHIATGALHTCAIRTEGSLWCWGWNGHGELGIGSHAAQDLPHQVTAPAAGGWASVTANYVHTCATRTGGTLWCWGYNNLGQLGIGNHTDQDQPQQVTIPVLGGWASVTAGNYHTCATRTSGTLWCWGSNEYGQLGIGNHTGQDQPRQVTGCTQPATQSSARQYLLHHHLAANASWRRSLV
jgi:alpha-tubulin suppressor-like RCC1 family protein